MLKINTRKTLEDRMFVAERINPDGVIEYAAVVRYYTWFGLGHVDDYLSIKIDPQFQEYCPCGIAGITWHTERWKVEQALTNLWHLQWGTGPYEKLHRNPKTTNIEKFAPVINK